MSRGVRGNRSGGARGFDGIECTFSPLKLSRRFTTRYEKTLRNIALACALCWLRI